MPELSISPQAREDFKEVGRYPQITWGVAQRDRYLGILADAFEKLRTNERLGRSRQDIRDGLLSWPASRHVIFFRRNAVGDVEILRILHERMDHAALF